MIRTTPFHPRTEALNETGLWQHWAGHLSANRYQVSDKFEYFAVRNAAGVFDTSPLYKYRIVGPDAERFLAGILARDIRACPPWNAQYTCWLDDRGFVMEDGVVFRHADDDFLLTAARPTLGWFADHGRRMRVAIEDVSDDYGMLAIQGPRSARVLATLAPEVHDLGFFAHTQVKIADTEVTLSRTGYTGDLGYELTVPTARALDVLDAVLEGGQGHGLRPFGEEALMTVRHPSPGSCHTHVTGAPGPLTPSRSTPHETGVHPQSQGGIRMRPTRPLPRLAAAAATGAVLVLAASASAMAQGDQPPRPAHIHDGSCPTPGDVVHPLHDVSAEALVDGEPSAGDVAGDPSDDPADRVLVSMTTVDATVEELTSGEFAINVHESADLIDVFIACGDVAGTLLLVPDDTGDAPDATDDPDDADEAEGVVRK